MERATLVILPGVLIALAAILWAVPLVGAAHFPNKAAAMAGLKPLKSSTNSQLAHSNITVPMPVRFREARDSGLLVRVWINGSGPYTFAVDTGAGITVITDNLVQQARLQVTARRHMLTTGLSGATTVLDREAVIDRIALGEADNLLPSKSVAIIAANLPSDIDGILDPTEAYTPLGYSIDMPNREIQSFDPNAGGLNTRNQPPGGTVVRWIHDRRSRRPFVRLGDGRLALVDTGSGFGLAVSDTGLPIGNTRRGEGVRDISGGTIQSRRVAPTSVSIGSLVLRGVPTDILTGVEKGAPVILGRDALSPFRITFDPVRRLIEIAPPAENDR